MQFKKIHKGVGGKYPPDYEW